MSVWDKPVWNDYGIRIDGIRKDPDPGFIRDSLEPRTATGTTARIDAKQAEINDLRAQLREQIEELSEARRRIADLQLVNAAWKAIVRSQQDLITVLENPLKAA